MKSIVVSLAAAAGLFVAANTMAADMPPLAKELNCVACHAIDKKVVGPAWQDVANKYKGASTFNYNGKDYPLHEGLVMKVSKGGAGHWGGMPMPANDPSGAKKDKIEQLVTFITGLAK
jgi:cytochrome c551/c552